MSDSLQPVDCSPPSFSVHGILQARIQVWVAISFPGDLPDPGIEPRSPTLEADALTCALPGKPLNTRIQNQIERRHIEEGRRGHKPRDASHHWKLEKTRKRPLPRASGRSQPCQHLDFSPETDFRLLTSRTLSK